MTHITMLIRFTDSSLPACTYDVFGFLRSTEEKGKIESRFKDIAVLGWRDGSEVKSIDSSSRGPGL